MMHAACITMLPPVRFQALSSSRARRVRVGGLSGGYRNSGVITFLVNHQGSVYEKDLRPNTARIAGGMTAFNPDNTWRRVTDAAQPSTGAK